MRGYTASFPGEFHHPQFFSESHLRLQVVSCLCSKTVVLLDLSAVLGIILKNLFQMVPHLLISSSFPLRFWIGSVDQKPDSSVASCLMVGEVKKVSANDYELV